MIQLNPEFQKKVTAIVQMYLAAKPGDEFSHAQVAITAQETEGSCRYRSVISAARKRLEEEHKIGLRSVRGFGYARAFPAEHFREGGKKIRCAYRRYKSGKKTIEHVDLEEATQQLRDQVVQAQRTIGMFEESLKGATQEIMRRIGAVEQRPKLIR